MRHAFTLIELLVVVTIIAVLLALLTPALDKAVTQAESLQCAAIQRKLGVANFLYSEDFRKQYVPVKTAGQVIQVVNGQVVGYTSWPIVAHYRQLIGIGGNPLNLVWPKGYACPSAKQTWVAAGQGWRTMAFNWSNVAPAWDQHLGVRRTRVSAPSDKVQMVDSNDWHTPANHAPSTTVIYRRADFDHVDGWNTWQESETSVKNALVSYRHTEGANLLHFDTSVRYLRKQEAWKKDPLDDANEPALNARVWRVYE